MWISPMNLNKVVQSISRTHIVRTCPITTIKMAIPFRMSMWWRRLCDSGFKIMIIIFFYETKLTLSRPKYKYNA